MHTPAIAALAAAALLALLAPQAQAAARYSALDITPAGTVSCQPAAVNGSGQVVGTTMLSPAGPARGFVTGPNGVGARLVDTLGGSHSRLQGLNDRGEAVGQASVAGDTAEQAIVVAAGATVPTPIGQAGRSSYATTLTAKGRVVGGALDPADGLYHGFLTSGARYRPLSLAAGTTPMGVLADGTVAGAIDQPGGGSRAFITGPDGQGMTLLGTLGGHTTFALGMNKSGVLVGFAGNADGSAHHAFVTDPGGGQLRDLGVPGLFALAQNLNNKGKVVGFYTDDWSRLYAFVATIGGTWKTLDSLVTLPGGATLTQAWGINDAGQISASGSDGRCYLLTPLP